MNQLQANAVQVIERATALERQGALADAHKAYEDGVRILQSILVVEGSKMSPLAREQLMAYMQRVEAKVLALRQRLPAPSVLSNAHHKDPTTVAHSSSSLLDDISSLSTTDKKGSAAQPPPHKPPQVDVPPSTSPTPSSAKATPPPAPSSAADAGLPLLPALPVFKATPSHVGKKSPAAPKASQDSTPPPAAAPAPKDVPDSQPLHYIPPDQKQPTRTSAVVMRAIELATQLSKEKKFKQAVDVLQHAYDAGRMEGNNPSNFNKVHDLILDLRRRYYEAFKPRFFQDNGVTKEEMELLRRSGQTKSILLPMWDDVGDGYAAENVYLPCKGDSWEDAFTPYISQKQKASACILERFPRLVSNPALLQVYHEADPMNIKQTVVGDCSLVCSLIVCTNFQKRFPQYNLISGVIFPQDASGKPIVSPKGKYCVKMLVNGITRMVVVDDRIPVSRTMQPPPPPSPVTSLVATLPVSPTATPQPGEAAAPSTTPDAASVGETVRFLKHPLCTYSRNPAEMWVCIIEKAFVNVCGGSYDFPGSNSSVDMFKLSGWLPDGFHFDGEDVDLELQWRRLLVNHNRGAVLATISTPQNLSKEVEEKLKLVPGHAYAILSILDQDGRRLVKIKNPWARQSWEGLYSLNDKQWPQELLAALAFTPQEAEQGVFWMSWADVCRYYKRCNLSWNPYLLFAPPPSDTTPRRPNRLAVHGVLTFSDSFAESPQYHLMVRDLPKPARVHIVLARHILDLAKEYANRADDTDDSPLIALQVFDVTATPTVAQILAGRGASGNPSCVGGSCMARLVAHGSELHGGDDARVFKGVYKNVEAQTVSFNCPAGNSDLVLVVSQYKGVRGASFPFSLFVHTDVGIGTTGPRAAIHRIPPPAPHAPPEDVASHSNGTLTSVFEGMWKSGSTCGGKNDSQTFVYNPQYQLTLSAPSHVTAYLNAPWNKDSVQLQLVRKRVQQPPTNSHPWQQRVDAIQSRTCDIVLQSPMYCNGSVVVDTAIGACLAFDTTGTLKTPVGPAPPPISAVPPPSPPPPPLLSGPKPIQVNVPKASKSFSIAEAPSSLPAAALIIVGALANALLATPSHSKVVFRGAAIAVDDGVSGERAKHKTLAELGDCSEPFVLLLNTEELQRTQPLQLLVLKLYEEAKLAIALVEALAKALRAPPPRDCSSTVSECKHAAERITQLLTKLDDVQCPSDPIRTTRKAVIMACHVLHDLMDGMIVAASSGGGGTSSPVPMPPAAPAIAVEPPLNQLPAGIYTLIPSTWSKGSASPFSIWLTTTAPHQVHEIPAEGSEWKSAVLQSQFRGAAPPSADVFFATAPGQRCALPPGHPLFATQSCATICAPRSGCQFTCRLMTIEGNPQQERSSVGVCLALFAVLGSGEVAGGAHRRMELVHVTPYTNSSCCIEPTPLVAQQPYVLVAMSAAPSNLPIVLRCFGSSEFTAKVNN